MTQLTKAYLLVQTERWGTTVADRLRAIPGVELAADVTGPYDALALVGSIDDGGVGRILDTVRGLPGVLRVIAAPVVGTDAAGHVDAA